MSILEKTAEDGGFLPTEQSVEDGGPSLTEKVVEAGGPDTAERSSTEEGPPTEQEAEVTPNPYKVSVESGTGGGRYLPGTKVTIKADIPEVGKKFSAWIGDISELSEPNNASQTFSMPARNLTFTATYQDAVTQLSPCQGALCWLNAPGLGASCGLNTVREDFSSGRYNVHRFLSTLPKSVDLELTLERTAGTVEPALIIQETTGATLYDGTQANSSAGLTITSLSSGKGFNKAAVRLQASSSMQVHIYVTSWDAISGNFATAMATNVKYTLTLDAKCPVGSSVCPLEKSRITHFGSGFFTTSDSSDKNSPNYSPYKRDTRDSHSGYDLHAPLDTPVVATQSGTIISSTSANVDDCGRSINLAADSGVTFRYCHLNSIVVSSGPVKAGQLIAYNGMTGNANSPHVHFVYLDAPNVTNSGTTAQKSIKVNQYVDLLCR